MELQQATSRGFNIYMNCQLCLWNRHATSSHGREKKLVWKNYVYDFLYQWEVVDHRMLPKRSEIQPGLLRLGYSSRIGTRKKRGISGVSKVGLVHAYGPLKKSWWSQNPGKMRYERPLALSSSILFSWPESMWFLTLWNGQWKNEGWGISHSPRYSRLFDGDLEWPHFRRRPICVPSVADPPKLSHRERLRILFWIE
jgi:hypothetical protein